MGTFGPTEPRQLPVAQSADPIFKEFYQTLGGQDLLGGVMSGLVERDGRKCQYVEAALMCISPADGDTTTRYQLEPIGAELQVWDDPQFPPPPNSGSKILDGGYVLFDEFAPLYDRLYGALYAGSPLTNVRVNHDTKRYEQFFTNVGFYRNFSDPAGQVHLIPYGAYTCGPLCSRRLDEYWLIVRSGKINQPFELSLQRARWEDFGRPLAQPHLGGDGTLEQVYQNAVLYAPLDNLKDIHLRPLLIWMGNVPVQPPVDKNPHEQLVFYETENGLGHNVPVFFDGFIASYGGRELSGRPITELFPIQDGQKYSQCFENYCLDYDPSAPASERVSLHDFGRQYLLATDPGSLALRSFTTETVAVQLSEQSSELSQGEAQQLNIRVTGSASGQPMALVGGEFTIRLPNREPFTLDFPPTDAQGQSSVTLQPLEGLNSMDVVEYQACLNLPDTPIICAVDSFVYRGQ